MALKGIKVLEFMGLAPGPFCGTILADFGAHVTVVQRLTPEPYNVMNNGKKVLPIDIKTDEGLDIVKKLSYSSDVLLDTFRPGVMEKLGLGPEVLLKENPRLIYARLSGYGQSGHYKYKAGHDLNYVAMAGVLSAFKKGDNIPVPPPFIADFAGGSVMCALGILLALFERTKSKKGQIIDCSMTETTAYVATWLFKSRNLPIWTGEPGTNVLDGGFPFYRVYKTKDDKHIAVGALEEKFFINLLKGLKLENKFTQFSDPEESGEKIKDTFLTKTQDEWCKIFENLDACVTPVLDYDCVDNNICHTWRKSFYRDTDDKVIPEVAPKLSRTPGSSVGKQVVPKHGEHTIEILKELHYSKSEINQFIKKGCVYAINKCNL